MLSSLRDEMSRVLFFHGCGSLIPQPEPRDDYGKRCMPSFLVTREFATFRVVRSWKNFQYFSPRSYRKIAFSSHLSRRIGTVFRNSQLLPLFREFVKLSARSFVNDLEEILTFLWCNFIFLRCSNVDFIKFLRN